MKRFLDRLLYPGWSDDWDARLFRQLVLSHLTPGAEVLDLGAGAGLLSELDFRGLCRRIVGVDPDPCVRDNPFLDEAVVSSGLPFPEASFDLVLCHNVCEHLEEPTRTFAEVYRVLRPGGRLLLKTPNRRHYVPLIARLTPHWFHQWVNELRGRPARHTYPTFYRANTPTDLRRLCGKAGLELENLELVEGRPEYLRMTPFTYLVGWLYERLVNSIPALKGFRVVLLATCRRPP